MAVTNLLQRYVRVTPEFVCPICGHDDWCLVNNEGTGAICNRESSDSPRGDAGHFHLLDGSDPPPVEARVKKDLIPKSRLKTFQVVWQQQLTSNLLTQLSQQLGLKPEALRGVGLGWRGDCYTFPMHDAQRQITGFRLRSPSGFKWTLAGTENGIFLPYPILQHHTLLVCEGPTDLAAALELGYLAIGRPNCTSLKEETKKLIVRLAPEHVIIVADGDGPGIVGAEQFQDYLAPNIQARVIVPMLHNDLREFVASDTPNNSLLDTAVFNKDSPYWKTL